MMTRLSDADFGTWRITTDEEEVVLLRLSPVDPVGVWVAADSHPVHPLTAVHIARIEVGETIRLKANGTRAWWIPGAVTDIEEASGGDQTYRELQLQPEEVETHVPFL